MSKSTDFSFCLWVQTGKADGSLSPLSALFCLPRKPCESQLVYKFRNQFAVSATHPLTRPNLFWVHLLYCTHAKSTSILFCPKITDLDKTDVADAQLTRKSMKLIGSTNYMLRLLTSMKFNSDTVINS